MKMKIIILACVVAVCCAQPQPVKPNLPETFTSRFDEFEKHRGTEMRGTGTWDRSVAEKKFMEEVTFGTQKYRFIGDFNSEIRYEINGTKCEERKMEGEPEFPVVWKWLEDAKFHEFKDPRTNKTLDAWSVHGDRGSMTLLVSAMDPDKPLAIMERRTGGSEGEEERDRRFTTFEATNPSPAVFEPPSTCMPPPPRRH